MERRLDRFPSEVTSCHTLSSSSHGPQSMSSCYCLPLLFAFFPPMCVPVYSKLAKKTKTKNKKTHDHDECSPLTPLILRRRKGERLPQGQALLVWPNAVWHSQQLPLRLCMTASAVTSFFFFFFCCLLLFAPAFSEQKKNNKKGHVCFSRMVTHDK